MNKKALNIMEYLYYTDPLNTSCQVNCAIDEYESEAEEIVDSPDDIKEIFENAFYEGCMDGKEDIIEDIRRILNE